MEDPAKIHEYNSMWRQAYEQAYEPSFSNRTCDSCGTYLAGDRHPAHGFLEGAPVVGGEIVHLDICTDCVMFHANGDLPE